MTAETIQAELTLIWKEFNGKFQSQHLNEVLERPFAFAIPEQSDILITGINPSYHPTDNRLLRYQYKLVKHRYFTILRRIVPATIYGTPASATYVDLFYYQNTEQAILNDYYKENALGIDFLARQLKLTQNIIEWIAPQLILIMNKGSWQFWGKNTKHNWMGYELKLIDKSLLFGELFEIIGLKDHPDRIAPELIQTNLIGTKVYFSKYLKRVSNANIELIRAEIYSIAN